MKHCDVLIISVGYNITIKFFPLIIICIKTWTMDCILDKARHCISNCSKCHPPCNRREGCQSTAINTVQITHRRCYHSRLTPCIYVTLLLSVLTLCVADSCSITSESQNRNQIEIKLFAKKWIKIDQNLITTIITSLIFQQQNSNNCLTMNHNNVQQKVQLSTKRASLLLEETKSYVPTSQNTLYYG